MNKFIGAALLLPALFACTRSNGQHMAEEKVPLAVKTAFATRFPKAEHVKWELEDGKDFEAAFKQDAVEWSATYTADATWLSTEHAIKAEALPEPVRKAIDADYAGHKMEDAEVLETPEGTFYEVDLEKGEHSMEVVFAPDGKMVRAREEDEETKDDEEDD